MVKFTRALARLFGGSAARAKPKRRATEAKKHAPDTAAQASAEAPARPAVDDDMMVSADDLVAPRRDESEPRPRRPQTRDEIIAEALRVQREKSRELDKIPLEDRARLRYLAEKVLLGGGGSQTRH